VGFLIAKILKLGLRVCLWVDRQVESRNGSYFQWRSLKSLPDVPRERKFDKMGCLSYKKRLHPRILRPNPTISKIEIFYMKGTPFYYISCLLGLQLRILDYATWKFHPIFPKKRKTSQSTYKPLPITHQIPLFFQSDRQKKKFVVISLKKKYQKKKQAILKKIKNRLTKKYFYKESSLEKKKRQKI
jgi:hypothetical protein